MKIKYRLKSKYNLLLLSFIISFLGYLAIVGLNIFLAHHLPVNIYGDLMVALAALALLTTIALFGTHMNPSAYSQGYLETHKGGELHHYIDWHLKFIKIPFIVSVVLAVLSFIILYVLHLTGIKDIGTYHLVVYMAWLGPLAALSFMLNSYLHSQFGSSIISSLYNLVQHALILLFFFIAIVALEFGINVWLSIAVLFIAYTCLFLIYFFLARVHVENFSKLKFSSLIGEHHSGLKKSWHRRQVLDSTMNLLSFSNQKVALLIVELIEPTGKSVAYFAVSLIIVSIIPSFVESIVVGRLDGNNAAELKEHKKKVLFCRGIIFLLVIVLVFCSKGILRLFGVSYLYGHATLIIFAIGYGVNYFISPLGGNNIALEKSRYNKVSVVVKLVFTVILSALSTYRYGIVGTAVSVVVIMLVDNITRSIYSALIQGKESLSPAQK